MAMTTLEVKASHPLQDPSFAMEGKKLHVLIVGAGIAGLTTSIALRQKGHRVTVLEAAPQVRAPLKPCPPRRLQSINLVL